MGGDAPGERDRLGHRLDACPLAPGVAFHGHVQIASGDGGGLRTSRDDDLVVGRDRDLRPRQQLAETAELRSAQDVVGDEDVV